MLERTFEPSPEPVFHPSDTLIEKAHREIRELQKTYKTDEAIWKALTNLGIHDQNERNQFFRKMKALQTKTKAEAKKQSQHEDALLTSIRKDEMMRDAYQHERSQPRDAWDPNTDEEN